MISIDLPNSPMLLEPAAISADQFSLVPSELITSFSEVVGLVSSSSRVTLRSEAAPLCNFVEAGVLIQVGFAVITSNHSVITFSS